MPTLFRFLSVVPLPLVHALGACLGWLAWGFIHIAFLTGVSNRLSTLATWFASIARRGRYHRAFMLGSEGTPEARYTWSIDDQSADPEAV